MIRGANTTWRDLSSGVTNFGLCQTTTNVGLVGKGLLKMWLEPTPWDLAQQEHQQQDAFAAAVANAIQNGGAPVREEIFDE